MTDDEIRALAEAFTAFATPEQRVADELSHLRHYLAAAAKCPEAFDLEALLDRAVRAVAALDEVLALHSLTASHRHIEHCREHRGYGRVMNGVDTCPDCVIIERTGCCDRCEDERGDPAPADQCEIRQAITRALLGEETPDGQRA